MQSPACLLVRAEVRDEADYAKFDEWYATEHLPDAMSAFGAVRAWRCWSSINPGVHHAYYEFPSEEAALAILDADAIKALITEFDEVWGDRVRRSREILKVAGRLG
ncbi:MAG: hypothetical protein KKB37_16500 [Alphaproteobacteria bacterium]|nr:hypothetical protein [Alphaproteobacteria bacterium]